MKRAALLLAIGFTIGITATTVIDTHSVNAQTIQSWSRDQVVAFLFVKPSVGGFVPSQGNSIGLSWSKDQVVPICLVKPSIGGFVPVEGSTIGNTWSQNEVKPVVFVESQLGIFTASTSTPVSPQASLPNPPTSAAPRSCSPAVETRIDGDFNGWEGETIYKMDDGSIWQQSTYHYHYHFTFHPSVTIYPTRYGTCHIKVEGDDDDGVDVLRIR
jgi:hypothetical protein